MPVRRTIIAAALGTVLCAGFALAPASGASDSNLLARRPVTSALRSGIGSFTPAAADPRLAALFARGSLANSGFRFTPVAIGRSRAITVAVRAASGSRQLVNDRVTSTPAAPATIGIAPVAYNLGASLGWKRFALSGDVARFDTGIVGGREATDIGLSYNSRKWSTRVQLAAERPIGNAPRTITGSESYSVDVGGSFRLTRRLDVTAGVRYRTDRDRLQPSADDRRDSQAVYVGTAIRF